jgi:hypothetical protein
MKPTPHEATLFRAALPLAGAERAAFLDRECAGDPALPARLEALLAAHDQPDTMFGTQPGAASPTISLDGPVETHELPTAWLRRCAMVALLLLLLLLLPHAQAASFLDHWRDVCDDFRENY